MTLLRSNSLFVTSFRQFHSSFKGFKNMPSTKKRSLASLNDSGENHNHSDKNDDKQKNLVIVIAGPTAVGKSKVAAKLCSPDWSRDIIQKHARNNATGRRIEENTGGHIISADSVQVYEGLQIGANKPSETEREQTPHHLIDIVDGRSICQYNAADWMNDAIYVLENLVNLYPDASDDGPMNVGPNSKEWEDRKHRIDDFIFRSKSENTQILPVVVGGTMMYLQWLIHGRPDAMKPSDTAIQKASKIVSNFQEQPDEKGWLAAQIYASELGDLFKQRVSLLAENDWYRLRRTLEIAFTVLEGDNIDEKLDQLYNGQREGGLDNNPLYDVRCFFLCPDDRMAHTAVVDSRCEEMLIQGLLSEATDLSLAGMLPEEGQQARAIGYRQALDYLKRKDFKEQDSVAFGNFLNSFTASTRQYAKKQMQWFRKDERFMFIPVNVSSEKPIESAADMIRTLCSWPREEFNKALSKSIVDSHDDEQSLYSVSTRTKIQNEAQGKKMKFYQPKRHTLVDGSDLFNKVLSDADECASRLRT